jgi:two-component system, NtrC family, response regulator HydG
MPARLIALTGPLEGETFQVLDGEFTIGHDRDNALCVSADDRVSRRHAVIHAQDQQCSIHDLSERSRTYVNQRAVSTRLLEHGDEIRVGRSTFAFVLDGAVPTLLEMARKMGTLKPGFRPPGSRNPPTT